MKGEDGRRDPPLMRYRFAFQDQVVDVTRQGLDRGPSGICKGVRGSLAGGSLQTAGPGVASRRTKTLP